MQFYNLNVCSLFHKQFTFKLPKDQDLEVYLNSDVYYNKSEKYLSFIKTFYLKKN
jgi:hypothetical protein